MIGAQRLSGHLLLLTNSDSASGRNAVSEQAHQGWSNDPNVSLRHRIVVYVADHSGSGIEQISTELGVDDGDVAAVVPSLGGLLIDPGLAGSGWLALGTDGEAQVQAWAALRRHRATRAMACRSALLDWLYDEPESQSGEGHELLDDARGYFYGVQFSVPDIDEARDYLGAQGLLEGIAAWGASYLRPCITAAGKVCVESFDSDVAAYLHQARGGNSVSYNTNIDRSSGVQVANASPGASMHSSVTITDDHRQQLVEVTRQIAEHIASLPAELKPAATEALAELEAAVRDQAPNKGRIRAAFEKVVVAGSVAFGTEAGKAMVGLAGQAIGSLPS